MRIPVIQGVIERRILVNYRVDPAVMARWLPRPFRPQLHGAYAVAGICLIRLRAVRPRGLPSIVGLRSENAAHRIAVEWDSPEGRREGVYIPRRDSSSRLNTMLGGRLFPGVHHHARFTCLEGGGRYDIDIASRDSATSISLRANESQRLPVRSIFADIQQASAFFERGSLGYSATHAAGEFDGLELRCQHWDVQPLEVESVQSSFFDDGARFPAGAAQFDCALLMRDIRHEWHGREALRCDAT